MMTQRTGNKLLTPEEAAKSILKLLIEQCDKHGLSDKQREKVFDAVSAGLFYSR